MYVSKEVTVNAANVHADRWAKETEVECYVSFLFHIKLKDRYRPDRLPKLENLSIKY